MERHMVGEELFLTGQSYNEPLSSWGTRPQKRKKKVSFSPSLASTLCAVSGSFDHLLGFLCCSHL